MLRDPSSQFKINLIAIIALVLAGALVLWFALRTAFSLTERLSQPPL